MSFRTVVIVNKAKLSYKNNYLIVRSNEVRQIHLSEINTIIIDSTAVTITSYLINELLSRKIKLVFCDEKRNPCGEVMPYYGSHNSTKKIMQQIEWSDEAKVNIWTNIIIEKIKNQANLLKSCEQETYKMLYGYIDEIQPYDSTNREGHAAKVYFNTLFGKDFSRDDDNDINAMLNYGYSIILSQFNREIVAYGYLTQLGIKHKNEFNPYNLASDIMEPYRQLVDKIVYENKDKRFDGAMKAKLINVLNHQVNIKNSNQYVTNAISIYVKSVMTALEKNDASLIEFYKYEL